MTPIREELEAHIAARARDLETQGVPRDEAVRRAREEFGAVDAYEAQCRREVRVGRLTRLAGGIGADIKHSWRRLRMAPVFTIFAASSLAIGVGVTLAAFTIASALFWRSSGIPNERRAAFVAGANSSFGASAPWHSLMSRPEFDELARNQKTFSALAATTYFYQAAQLESEAVTIQGEGVSGAYFDVLGVQTLLGRPLTAADDEQRAAVAIVSHAFWTRHLGGDRSVVGRVMRVGGHPFEIVGVAQQSFDGTIMQMPRLTEVWIPLGSTALFPYAGAASLRPGSNPRVIAAIGRLAADGNVAPASAEVAAFGRELDRIAPITTRAHADAQPAPLARAWHAMTVADAHAQASAPGTAGALVMLVMAMLLIVACTNLANLTLARGIARHHERTIRRSLGATRWRLVREQAIESAMIAIAGGLGAFAVAQALLVRLPDLPLSQGFSLTIDAGISAAAVGVTAGAVLLSLTVFGLIPALQLTRSSMRGDLASRAAGVTAARTPAQYRSIRWQVVIASSFFILATASMRSVVAEARHDSGIDLDRIAIAHTDFYLQRWDRERVMRAVDAIVHEGSRQPGLEAIAVSSGMPFGTTMTPYAYLARMDEAFAAKPNFRNQKGAIALAATPGIFRALGLELLSGRFFDGRDATGAPAVVVMGALAAREVFGTADVIGRELQLKREKSPWWPTDTIERARIIGIVSDADTTHLTRRSGGIIYRPLAQQYEPLLTIVGRTAGDTGAAVDALRAVVRRADPEVSINRAGTGFRMLAGFYLSARIAAGVTVTLGVLALLLSMAGLHGVLAQMMSMRTREVGLRMALGAETRAIHRMVLGDGFRPVLQGLAIGLLAGVLGRFVLRATVASSLPVFDPVGLVLIPIPVCLAALAACYLPARQASRVDPNAALRAL